MGAVSLDGMIRQMITVSGKSASQVSRDIGKSSGYLGTMLHNGTVPSFELLVDIATACGFAVVIESPAHDYVAIPKKGLRATDESSESSHGEDFESFHGEDFENYERAHPEFRAMLDRSDEGKPFSIVLPGRMVPDSGDAIVDRFNRYSDAHATDQPG